MSSSRPPPQAKYELLGEHARTTSNTKRAAAAAVLIIAILGITVITIYLSWNGINAVGRASFLHLADHQNNDNVMTQIHQKRLEQYGRAFMMMENNNSSVTEYLTVSNVTVNKSTKDTENATPMLVCYYSFPGADDLTPEAIDPNLCTHIIIASMSVVNKSLSLLHPAKSKVVKQVVALKAYNSALKVMICVGGYSGPGGFNDMVATHETRKQFIKEILSLAKEYSLDGIDLDWEFPAWQGAAMERVHFSLLLKEIREELNKKKLQLLLSVAVAAPRPVIDVAYDVPELAQYLDFINLMAYDYHFYVPYLPTTGANAPLYSRPDEKGYFRTLNTNWSAFYWMEKGMPKNKIVVGVPTYGHSFRLMNPANHGWSAPAIGFGSLGSGGFVSYRQVCAFLAQPGTNYQFDKRSKVPYAFNGREWVSYDDNRSVSYKAEYIVNNDYAGAMVFSLNQDDYEGICTSKTFRLTRQLKIILMDDQLFQMEKSLSIALGIH
ncbi:chitinase-3-like protein 2 [Anabrus simplex]|uniref:chitinase-3-like protein 2 n=1 Tax=Anabrus simplex TaxID=316456 RepID=UPI0035A2C9D5